MLKKCAWETYDEKHLKKLEKLSKEYRDFLDNGKTERECIDTIVNTIEAEGYKELVIDFRGIEFMGRGFADEVFRVFQEEHPEIKITPLHASTSMLAMIRHLGGKQQ